VVAVKVVGRVSYPEGSHRDISLEHIRDSERTDGKVVADDVMSLNAVLDEEVVPMDSVSYVLLNSQVVNSVDSDDSGEGLMYSVSPGEGSGNVASHMEVNAIPTQNLWLSALSEL